MDNMWTVLKWYQFFLHAPTNTLTNAVDKYNSGILPINAKRALEIIEGLDMND